MRTAFYLREYTKYDEENGQHDMKDENGVYYYPFTDNRHIRMYVMDDDGVICFRMWNQDDPELWKIHGWVPYRAIMEAMRMNTQKHFDPAQAYDIRVARALLDENQ